jgi:hypothetical protein
VLLLLGLRIAIMSSLLRLLPSSICGGRPEIDEQLTSSPDVEIYQDTSKKDVKDEKKSPGLPSVDKHEDEITTVKDPTLNPGGLTFEEGRSPIP